MDQLNLTKLRSKLDSKLAFTAPSLNRLLQVIQENDPIDFFKRYLRSDHELMSINSTLIYSGTSRNLDSEKNSKFMTNEINFSEEKKRV